MTKRRKKIMSLVLVLVVICLFIYLGTGFFVIQPIGALPDGATVWYWRFGTKMAFISSADGMLLKNGHGVSLMGRAAVIGAVGELLKNRKIVALPYSRTLYLISTGGCGFER